ncbi:Ribonuclease H2 subunit C [Zea mays]|uniref:Ribonuclease H2 subunit C n=1 Tax=Zea mays TaxID=4577 RepID=A0A3L6ESL9_MAIZE|nr:Ribonuclease H2 subunit C [Zea mays]
MEPATPPAPAAGVTATVDLSSVAADLGGAHLLPCGIRQNGGAPVSDYFKPRATGVEVEGVKMEEAFFRGRKLQGTTLALPDGYRGYVLEKSCGQNSDAEVSNFTSRAEFQSITYWNHDTAPSAEDSLPRCFHWLTVANAMHRAVTAEDLANMAAMQNQGK